MTAYLYNLIASFDLFNWWIVWEKERHDPEWPLNDVGKRIWWRCSLFARGIGFRWKMKPLIISLCSIRKECGAEVYAMDAAISTPDIWPPTTTILRSVVFDELSFKSLETSRYLELWNTRPDCCKPGGIFFGLLKNPEATMTWSYSRIFGSVDDLVSWTWTVHASLSFLALIYNGRYYISPFSWKRLRDNASRE